MADNKYSRIRKMNDKNRCFYQGAREPCAERKGKMVYLDKSGVKLKRRKCHI